MSITLDQVTKRYGGMPVVNDLSLDIGDGEFFVLLGPSGSGKSTLLRAIAGLSGVEHGRISLHGRDVTHVAARKRGVGLVFQNYALFRHMTVADNIEFALRVRHMRARARRQRREELRRTIRQVQRELGITTVLVTHDQEEAFAMADRIGIMNQGRLLEVGAPHELYARPATRFVATFLGAANLFLARRTADGIQVGGKTMGSAERSPGAPEHEVVAVVRPEEIEVAPERDALGSRYLGQGVVDEVAFTGGLERLRVRLDESVDAPLLASGDGDGSLALQVTRTRHAHRGFEVQQGQSVAVGLRRVHVLPTPLSSFTACAPSVELADALTHQPLLSELVARMKTRIAVRVEPALGMTDQPCLAQGEFFGTTVIAAAGDAARRAEWLLRRGVKDLLVLPGHATPPQRVLIHWLGEAARSATLAVSASVLRHVPAEAVYVGIFPGDSDSERHSHGMRELLDARSEAQAAHGLEMRTELHFGDVAQELTRRLADAPAQMLILGVTELQQAAAGLRALLDGGRWPVLIVQRGAA